ncbi:toxin Cry1Ac domain D-VI-related protein, partial [Enterococcus sp. DIV0660C]|uniref:toxin Cry1Ac domain D-VI-related protein n=1 Tax=Enterococcus sp. DIV0660C TaxID=2230880 RepID=UPI001A8DB6F7
MKSFKYCLASFLILGNMVTTPLVSALEQEVKNANSTEKVDEKLNQTTNESNIDFTENSKKQVQASDDVQTDSSSGTPRYSVGQTVDLMDQNTKKRWNITIEKDFYQVNQYLGRNTDTDVVIPTEMSIVLLGTMQTKKKVRVNGGSTKFMQNATGNPITSFRVEGNKEVLVNGVERFNNFFRNSSIESVDLTGLNINVIDSINMSNMFQGCSKLKNVKFGTTDFNNVTNMSRMFSGCTSLQSLDLSMLNTNKKALDMSYMFENTPALRKIDLRNTSLDTQDTNKILGDRATNETAVGKPLSVIVNPTTSSKFLNFDFVTESGRIPEAFPTLDANGGAFSSGASTLKYIDKICVTPKQLELSNFNSWKEGQTPSRKNHAFLGWKPSKNVNNATSIFDLLGVTYSAEWDNSIQEATNKVNGLFNGENLADGVNQDKINEAQAAVDKVTDEAKKQELQNKIDKAQELLNKQDEQAQIVQEATDKVNGLFNGENLADGVNQDKINEAQAAVDKVTDGAKKQELQNKIDKAQELLDKQDEQFAITSVDPYKEGISQYVTGTYKGKDAGYIRLM